MFPGVWVLPSHSPFMISGGVGPLGPSGMECPFRIYKPKVPGPPLVCGDISNSLPLTLPLLQPLSVLTSLFDYCLLGVWGLLFSSDQYVPLFCYIYMSFYYIYYGTLLLWGVGYVCTYIFIDILLFFSLLAKPFTSPFIGHSLSFVA